MVVGNKRETVEALRAEVGDSLRVVASYDEDGYDVFYVRDDVAGLVAENAEDVHEELVLQGLGRGHLEDLFGGDTLECSMHRFEELTAFHFAAGEFSGLFVSIDSDADVPLATFAETCKSTL